jgi:hypothetical protein
MLPGYLLLQGIHGYILPIGGVAGNTVGRYLAFDFLRENFDTINK